jgi:hypothetical protein
MAEKINWRATPVISAASGASISNPTSTALASLRLKLPALDN